MSMPALAAKACPQPAFPNRVLCAMAGITLFVIAGHAWAADEVPFPSAEWTLREAHNYSRTQDATAIQATAEFQQRWQQQSFVNSQDYLAREREDTGWNSRGNACKEWAEPCTGDPYRYPGWDAFYDAEGRVEPVIFFDAQGARLSGRVWAPIDSRPGARLPVIVINNGSVQVPETAYWWATQMLVRNGYMVLSFDPRGQGRSDNRTPDGEAGSNSNPSVFVTNLIDAVDFVRSTPDAPYANNQRYTRAPSTPFNPFWNRIDAERIGLAGHSLGARGVSVVQGLQPWPGASANDNPVDVIVAWDNLAAAGAAGAFVGDVGDYLPRVPAMGQSADYWLAPQPKLEPPDPLDKSPGVALWRKAGVPVFQIQIQGGTHYEWSLMPTLPTSAWEPGGDGGWGQPLVRHYTLAWFDRWLKQPGEIGYADADTRLLDDAYWRPRMSFYYLSSRDYPSRDGQRQVCEDLRAACSNADARNTPAAVAGGRLDGLGLLLMLVLAGWRGLSSRAFSAKRAKRPGHHGTLITAALLASACGGDAHTPNATVLTNAVPAQPLRIAADAASTHWGAAVTVLRDDALGNPEYDAALAGNFNLITAENELKLPFLRAPDGSYNFAPADRIADFARAHGMKMHGHVLVWREDLSPWLGDSPSREAAIALMREHIFTVLGHYREHYPDVFIQWDVVNEAHRSDGSLRASGWHQAIGDDFIELAFQFAHQVWPELTLFYNDFYELNMNAFGSLLDASGQPDPDAIRPGIGPHAALSLCEASAKCMAVRAMAEDFVARDVPLHAVGFQAHIPNAVAPDYGSFAAWVGPLGLQWIITELDAPCPNDDFADPSCFDSQADIFGAVVQACVDDPACDTVVQWGVADGYSWWPGLSAGTFGRPLALDRDFQYKPAAQAVLDALGSGAP